MEKQTKYNTLINFMKDEYKYTTEDLKQAVITNNITIPHDDETQVFTINDMEFLVLTKLEANLKTREYIEETLWAFNADFLAGLTELDTSVFVALQSCNEYDSNKAIRAIIDSTCGFDEFVNEAVNADGYGNFLASYDGEEFERGKYFIYRVN